MGLTMVKEILPEKIVVDTGPQHDLTTQKVVNKYKEKLQPFVQAVTDVLQMGPKTVEELIQARTKGPPKS